MKAIHYSGAVNTPRQKILPGWAACCSGRRAEKIREAGNITTYPWEVTCKACRRVMAKDPTLAIYSDALDYKPNPYYFDA